MSDALLKANSIVVKSEGKRVIDSNAMVSERLQLLSEILKRQEEPAADDFTEGFVEGLDADQVAALLSDGDGEYDGEFQQGLDTGEYYEDGNAGAMNAATPADAQKMLDEAGEEAERIIAEARAQAEDILAGATEESGQIRQNAEEQGYQAGFDRGHAEGLESVRSMEDDLAAKSQALDDEYEKRVEELEPQFIEALTDIYAYIFNVDMADKTKTVLHLLRNAIRNIEGTKNYFVHVSKDDFEAVNAAKDDLVAGLGSQVVIEIIEDITLKASECFIEADSGIFDCSLGTELELLKKELMLLSYRRES